MAQKPKSVLIFLHGWLGNSKSLLPLAQKTSEQTHLPFLVFDLPGFGVSENPPPHFGVEEYAGWVDKKIRVYLKQNKLNRAILIGHSFGGALTLFLASQKTSYLEKIIVIAPSFQRSKFTKTSNLQRFKSLFFRFLPLMAQKIIYKLIFPNSERFARLDLKSNFEKITNTDLTDKMSAIDLPTLILSGDKDSYVDLKQSRHLHALIRSSKIKILPMAGHSLPLKELDWCSGEITKFLS